MAATVQIREKNGAGENATDKTSSTVRPKMADDPNVDSNDPLVIPATGQNYSYEKWLRLYIGATGPDTNITNPKFYTDGNNGFGTGVNVWIALDGTYTTPVTPSTANDPPQHDGVDMTNIFTYTSGSPLALDVTNTGPYSGTLTDFADYLVIVAEAEAAATQGSVPAEALTFVYDES